MGIDYAARAMERGWSVPWWTVSDRAPWTVERAPECDAHPFGWILSDKRSAYEIADALNAREQQIRELSNRPMPSNAEMQRLRAYADTLAATCADNARHVQELTRQRDEARRIAVRHWLRYEAIMEADHGDPGRAQQHEMRLRAEFQTTPYVTEREPFANGDANG